jgi:hypothetical protein
MYPEFFGQMKKMLVQLDRWLEAGAAFASANGFAPDDLLELRLAPDQFAFGRQVMIAGDTAKLAAARLTGTEAPKQADTEATLEDLRARIRVVVAYLDGLAPAAFEGAATRVVTQPRWEGKVMTGADYFLEHAVPNFFFHITHSYAILRHRGVTVGKRDYLGALSLRAPAVAAAD